MSLLGRLAGAAPAPVFAAIGAQAWAAVEDLCLLQGVQRVASPRAASVLLVAGEQREADAAALRRVHDQMPHPRATVWWAADPPADARSPLVLDHLDQPHDAALRICELHRALMAEGRPRSEADWQPDEPPAPWQGVGPYGQGGEGMMGGTPYGRPMAMTDDDLRDGLALDAFSVRIGPFMPTLPPGLVLELTLQGDVLQRAAVAAAPAPQGGMRGSRGPARVWRCIGRVMDLLELPDHGERCRREAARCARGEPGERLPLLRALRRTGALRAIPPGLGRVPSEPGPGHDVRDRLSAWIDAAAAADDARAQPLGVDRVPLAQLLAGLEWHEAMLVIASFDPDALQAGDGP